MKKLLLLFVLSISLISCTGEELPANSKLASGNAKSKYFIEWQSNQIEPYMNIEIIHFDDKGEASYNTVQNIKEHEFEILLYPTDIVSIFVNSHGNTANPSCYLGISKYKAMDLSSNVYAPDKMDLLYEIETITNGLYYSSIVKDIKK